MILISFFAANNYLLHYSPLLGDYLLFNFIHPVYRLSRTTQGSPERTPASNKTPPFRNNRGATTLTTTDATFSKFTHIFMWVLQSPKQSSPELKEESPDSPADDLQRTYRHQEA